MQIITNDSKINPLVLIRSYGNRLSQSFEVYQNGARIGEVYQVLLEKEWKVVNSCGFTVSHIVCATKEQAVQHLSEQYMTH